MIKETNTENYNTQSLIVRDLDSYPLLVSPIRLSSSPEVSKVSGGHEMVGTASSELAPALLVPAAKLGIEAFSTDCKYRSVNTPTLHKK